MWNSVRVRVRVQLITGLRTFYIIIVSNIKYCISKYHFKLKKKPLQDLGEWWNKKLFIAMNLQLHQHIHTSFQIKKINLKRSCQCTACAPRSFTCHLWCLFYSVASGLRPKTSRKLCDWLLRSWGESGLCFLKRSQCVDTGRYPVLR